MRQIAKDKIRASYQKLLDIAPDAMAFVDKSGKIIMANGQMERLFGYTQSELAGADLSMLIPERFRKQHGKDLSFFFSSPKVRQMGTGLKLYALKKDGTEFRVDISLAPLDIDGEAVVAAAIRDITDRVLAEEQLAFDFQIQTITSSILEKALEPLSLNEQLGRILELVLSVTAISEGKGLIYVYDPVADKLALSAQRGFPETKEIPAEEEAGPVWFPAIAPKR
ncbi:MAG: PAS domain S-box protein [Actinomycetota bacterium]|nr:PAS domain S-box protein [Nitrospiraceae bacterium]MDA8157522.1 PAS domain S-box protein [Actinomycetota bacterium]